MALNWKQQLRNFERIAFRATVITYGLVVEPERQVRRRQVVRECMLEHQHGASEYRQTQSHEKRTPGLSVGRRERRHGYHEACEEKLMVGVERREEREQKQRAPQTPVMPGELPVVALPCTGQRSRRPQFEHYQH